MQVLGSGNKVATSHRSTPRSPVGRCVYPTLMRVGCEWVRRCALEVEGWHFAGKYPPTSRGTSVSGGLARHKNPPQGHSELLVHFRLRSLQEAGSGYFVKLDVWCSSTRSERKVEIWSCTKLALSSNIAVLVQLVCHKQAKERNTIEYFVHQSCQQIFASLMQFC